MTSKTIEKKIQVGKIDMETIGARISLALEIPTKEEDLSALDKASKSLTFRFRERSTWVSKDGHWRYDISQVQQRTLVTLDELKSWIETLSSKQSTEEKNVIYE